MSLISRDILDRATAFASRLSLRVPILLAPMAGACPPSLSIAVVKAGGLGACGALLMPPEQIQAWADEVRVRAFLGRRGPPVPPEAGDAAPPDFGSQCDALLAADPPVISSVMGVYPPAFVAQLKQRGTLWFAIISTVAEARAADAAGADVIVGLQPSGPFIGPAASCY